MSHRDSVKDIVKRSLTHYRMLERGDQVLTAVSGGADSVCLLLNLLDLSGEMGFFLRAVHVEHGIRGAESLEDLAFVKKLCAAHGIPLKAVRISVPDLAKASGRSLEEEARVQRYRIFQDLARETGCLKIAAAHHQGDQAETVLWNLIRGSGIDGLSGMKPLRPLGEGLFLIRPLLYLSREAIEADLRTRGVPFRTDSSNLDLQITRNRIRHEILPAMSELNHHAIPHIQEAAEKLREIEDFLERETEKAKGLCLLKEGGEIGLLLEAFLGLDPVIQKRILRSALDAAGGSLKDFSHVHINSLLELSEKGCGRSLDLPGGLQAFREEGKILFGRKEAFTKARLPSGDPGPAPFMIDGEGRVSFGALRFSIRPGKRLEGEPVPEWEYKKSLSYGTISQTLCIRTRQPGDFLVINREGGRKKLGDYLTDQKVPVRIRDQIPLVTDGSRILWVVGFRISEDAKVDPGQDFVEITLENPEELPR